jgi:hypothetical protein
MLILRYRIFIPYKGIIYVGLVSYRLHKAYTSYVQFLAPCKFLAPYKAALILEGRIFVN